MKTTTVENPLVLSTKPFLFKLQIVRNRLLVMLWFSQDGAHFSAYTSLTGMQADAFVASLAKACNYEVPGVAFEEDRVLSVWTKSRRDRLLISGGIPSRLSRYRPGSGATSFRVRITRTKAHQLLKQIAKPLGWELTEE